MPAVELNIVVSKDLEQVRGRLGNTGMIRSAMADVLDEGARLGEQSAKMYAPRGDRGGITRAISSQPAHRGATSALEAVVGVSRASSDGMSLGAEGDKTAYPWYVHEGTGLFGKVGQLIRPRRAKAMRFFGRTGLVFAKTVRGQKPQPYVGEAFIDVNEYIKQRIGSMVRRIIEGR